ncbi:MAG: hypothetical protein R3192_14930 [Woeseiaceae bacterium]|nr:hypothetical protein [Woeseiaceae bacterium]
MNDANTLAVISGRIDRNALLRQLDGTVPGISVVYERSVLYPYAYFEASCTVPTISGEKSVSLNGLVDGINGHGMTCDEFSTEATTSSSDKVLYSQIRVDEALRIARRTLTHALSGKLKMIAPFDVRLEARGTVYKRFFIVRIGNDRLMVDSISGHMQPLRARPNVASVGASVRSGAA